MIDIAKLFADYGGIIGLVILALFVLIAYLIYQQSQITAQLLKSVEESDRRLIDFKREAYKSLPLEDRRKEKR